MKPNVRLQNRHALEICSLGGEDVFGLGVFWSSFLGAGGQGLNETRFGGEPDL